MGAFGNALLVISLASKISHKSAANSELRKKLFALNDLGYKTFAPQMKFCTDNAAMVASCAYFNPIKTDDPLTLEAFSRS